MIHELSKENFNSILRIVHRTWDNIEINAVLAGNNPGWVFADSPDNPSTAMVWSKGIKGFYFVGNPENIEFNAHIDKFIDDVIRDRAINSGLSYFEFSGDSEAWDKSLDKIFGLRDLILSKQCVYKFLNSNWEQYKKASLRENYQLRGIDKSLLADKYLKNLDFIWSEILQWWATIDDFLDNAFGYCIICNNEIVSFCLVSYVYENTRAIGIETLKDHRRKGLSQFATEAFLSNCIANGFNPYWDCMFTNEASRSLAEKLGFYLDHTYSLYEFNF